MTVKPLIVNLMTKLKRKYILKSDKSLSIILVIILMSCGFQCFRQLRQLRTGYSIRQFMPESDPILVRERQIQKAFNLEEASAFLVAMTLAPSETGHWLEKIRIDKLELAIARLSKLRGIRNIVAISNVEGAGEDHRAFTVGPLFKLTPPKERLRLLDNPLLAPSLISKDARTVMLVVNTGFLSIPLMARVETELRHEMRMIFPSSLIRVGGIPAIQTDVGALLLKDLKNFVILAFIASIIALSLIFSNFSGIFITLLTMALTNIISLGSLAFFKIPFTVLSTTIPILVSITVLAIATHSMLRVDEESKKIIPGKKLNSFLLTFGVLKTLFVPNLLAALTTCVGFCTLMSSQVPVIKSYGITTAACVIVTWFLTNLSLLALIPLMSLPKARNWTGSKARWSLYIMKNRIPISVVIVASSVILAMQGTRMNWSPRLFDDLPQNHPTRVATEKIDDQLGGVLPLEIIVQARQQNAWNSPNLVARLDKILQKIRLQPGVGSAVGLPDFLRAVKLKKTGQLTRQAIAETYFLYSLAPKNPLRSFLISDGRTTRLAVRLHDLPAVDMSVVVRKLVHMTRLEFPEFRISSGGMAANTHILNQEISKDLIFSFWKALLLIGALLLLVFRSLKWAVVACVPNLVPPAILLGGLALFKVPIKPGIALIFSIAVGLSFNNTVYLLARIRSQNLTGDLKSRIRRAFYLESNPCIVSTMVIFTGFAVFLGSYFSLNRYFGVFMLLSILGGIVGDLILLPALLMIFPNLLSERSKKDRDSEIEISLLDGVPLSSEGSISGQVSTTSKVAASIVIFLFSALTLGAPMEARDILKKAEKQISSKDEVADVVLRIIESDGSSKDRKILIKRKTGSKNFVLVRIQSPSDLRGTGFLSVYSGGQEEQWLYLPSSKQTRRIVGGNRQSGFLGSEISYEDLSASTATGSITKLLREETIGGQKYEVLETLGKKDQSSYSRVLSWISVDKFLALKAEYFGWDKKLIKRISFQNYKQFNSGVWRAQLVKVKNVQTKRGTELVLKGLSVNKNIPDSDFSMHSLELD